MLEQSRVLPSLLVASAGVFGIEAPLVWWGLWLVGLGWPFLSHALLQEVAVEALLQATGLPAELLHHALTPLTHGEGVLVRSCTPGGECGVGAPRGCWGERT